MSSLNTALEPQWNPRRYCACRDQRGASPTAEVELELELSVHRRRRFGETRLAARRAALLRRGMGFPELLSLNS